MQNLDTMMKSMLFCALITLTLGCSKKNDDTQSQNSAITSGIYLLSSINGSPASGMSSCYQSLELFINDDGSVRLASACLSTNETGSLNAAKTNITVSGTYALDGPISQTQFGLTIKNSDGTVWAFSFMRN